MSRAADFFDGDKSGKSVTSDFVTFDNMYTSRAVTRVYENPGYVPEKKIGPKHIFFFGGGGGSTLAADIFENFGPNSRPC